MPCDPYFADHITDACQDGTLMPTTMHLQLCTTEPTAETPGTPAPGVERYEITMGSDWTSNDAGLLTSNTDFDYGLATDDTAGVAWAELYDAATGGQRYLLGGLLGTYSWIAGQPVKFVAGSFTLQVV
jgi:hypothetical protein